MPNEEFIQILMKCIQEINQHLRMALAPHNNPHISMMRSLLDMTMQLRITQNHINVLALLQKVSIFYAHGVPIRFVVTTKIVMFYSPVTRGFIGRNEPTSK